MTIKIWIFVAVLAGVLIIGYMIGKNMVVTPVVVASAPAVEPAATAGIDIKKSTTK